MWCSEENYSSSVGIGSGKVRVALVLIIRGSYDQSLLANQASEAMTDKDDWPCLECVFSTVGSKSECQGLTVERRILYRSRSSVSA